MNPIVSDPPPTAVVEPPTASVLMFLYQDVSEEVTGKTRWLGNQQKLKAGEGRWAGTFRNLVAKLRIWKFDAEQYLRYAIAAHELVIDRPNTLTSDWLLGEYSQYRGRSMADAVVEDKTIRGDLDLIRSSMEADVESLTGWQNFMPDYEQRLLNQCHALSLHFLATDTVFLELISRGLINQEIVTKVREVLVRLNKHRWFYQQVRKVRDRAIVDAGE